MHEHEPSAAENAGWIEADRRHVWHPYTQMQTAAAPIPVTHGAGVYLHAADGRRILDGISSWWVNIHGHAHPRLNRAIARQAERLEQVIFAGFTHEPAARLAARLAAAVPGRLPHVFFSDDGSTSVEVALKMAFQYWKNRGEDRPLFVAVDHAYHGDTFGAMALGGTPVYHQKFSELFFDVRWMHSPTCHACPVGRTRPGCGTACADHLETILQKEGDRVSAVIIEPMLQGAGGMIVWPPEFLRRVRELTSQHGVFLIADEVLTGFGRTGKLFACEHGPVTPDIICLSKALTGGCLPLAATLAAPQVYEGFLSDDRTRALFHGHSYTANALACAAANESLDMLEEYIAQGDLARLEDVLRQRLEGLRRLPCVLDARGIGAVAAIELRAASGGGYLDDVGPRLYARFLEAGILLRPLGNVLYFMPPYVISIEDVHRVFDEIERVLGMECRP